MTETTSRQTRRIPIDWNAIAAEVGMTHGTLCYTSWGGWVVRRIELVSGELIVDYAIITPPPMEDGETSLRIEGREWVFS